MFDHRRAFRRYSEKAAAAQSPGVSEKFQMLAEHEYGEEILRWIKFRGWEWKFTIFMLAPAKRYRLKLGFVHNTTCYASHAIVCLLCLMFLKYFKANM